MLLQDRVLDLQPTRRDKLLKASRGLYGAGIAGIGLHQLISGRFLQALFPAWPSPVPGLAVEARLVGVVLITAGMAIVLHKQAQLVSLLLSGLLLGLLCFSSIPYELLLDPYNSYVGSWTNVLTNLALAGGALTIAGSYATKQPARNGRFTSWIAQLTPAGKFFYCTTIVIFGITHFLYAKHLVALVPSWAPNPLFWTYFAGAALIGAGSAIMLGIKRRKTAFLLGAMIFSWIVLLHAPKALAQPAANEGQPVKSLLAAMAYSGTAFVIAVGRTGRTRRAD
jgi:uncharacterized membrane protein YphA (DoxX/SURF4 family)